MDTNIRTGQLLSPFGIGQIVTFPEEISLMVSGLDLWDSALKKREISGGPDAVNREDLKIPEDRLQKLLNVEYFMKPFPYTESGLTNNLLTIPGVRFPRWHHCTNPSCGKMKEIELNTHDDKIECDCGRKMIPVRFVAACEKGHIQDVPFKEWVHRGPVPDDREEHELRYRARSGSGDLGSIFISCSCGKLRSLAGIMNVKKDDESDFVYNSALAKIGLSKDDENEFSVANPNTPQINPTGQFCKGHKTWLGLDGVNNPDVCDNHLRVLIRGGSNVHYSNIQSAIYLPRTRTNEYIQQVIDQYPGGINQLKELYEQQEGGGILKVVLGTLSVVKNNLITIDELFDSIVAEFDDSEEDGEQYDEKDIRWDEYQYILEGRESENSDLKAVVKSFDGYKEREYLENYFSKIVLIEKLKETRVFTGFSRIKADRRSLEESKALLSNEPVRWLPAYEVHGEGIFLKFKSGKLKSWIEKSESHFASLITRYHNAMRRRKVDYVERDINPAFLMMHTFAHLLIKRLCYNCGYGSSSLRERIYFSSDPETEMNGIMIYTSSGDSEGSLGGLVRQGKEKYLAKLIKDSIADAEWCSADPVCSEVGQKAGQGPDAVNGSACHNCCLVPETSCEEFNTLLDRATITGTLEEQNLGYFNS